MSSGQVLAEGLLTDYRFLGGILLAFLFGFLFSRLLNRKSLNRMREDLEDLQWRLQSSERLLSGKITEAWERIAEAVPDVDVNLQVGGKHAAAPILDTGEQDHPQEATELPDSSRQRKVKFIKVEGPEGHVESPTVITGLEKSLPQIGKSYEIFTDYGTLIVTTPVRAITDDHVRTQNSLYRIEPFERDITRSDFEAVWDRILNYEGEAFETKTGMTFTYRITGDSLYTSRTNYKISKANFAKAFEYGPIEGPGAIKNMIIGPAYVWAILHDSRIAASK